MKRDNPAVISLHIELIRDTPIVGKSTRQPITIGHKAFVMAGNAA